MICIAIYMVNVIGNTHFFAEGKIMKASDLQPHITVLSLMRDFIVSMLPFRLPAFIRRWLYGPHPDFVFLTHPRYQADIFDMVPISKTLARIIPAEWIMRFYTRFPAVVVCTIYWGQHNLRGLVVSTPHLPQEFFGRRKKTLAVASQMIGFLRKITHRKVYIALSGWWPPATNKGRLFKQVLSKDDHLVVTTGHTATLMSLCRTVERVAQCLDHNLADTSVAILGVGNMGSIVAQMLNGRVARIGIIDKNERKAENVVRSLCCAANPSQIELCRIDPDQPYDDQIAMFLARHDTTVCTTLNASRIVQDTKKLRNCIIIDDSRPEAFERIFDPEKGLLIIEGGLMKIKDVMVDCDFGFGKIDSVFGCMSEAIMLAIDKQNCVVPILGEVDIPNYNAMLKFCDEVGIREGDLLCGHRRISPGDIQQLRCKTA